MNKTHYGIAACILAASISTAAQAREWTGCYVGGQIGSAWNSTTVNDEIDSSAIATLSDTNIIGGARVGCDWQASDRAVIGLTGSFDWTGLTKTTTSPALDPLDLTGKVRDIATLTARAGYLVTPETLTYAKVGVAWTRTNATLSYLGTTEDSVSFTQTGVTAGAGVEQRLGQHFSVFAEYNYYGASSKVVDFPNTSNIGNVHQHNQAVMVGANFRFGGW